MENIHNILEPSTSGEGVIDAQPPETGSGAGRTEGDLVEDTLLESLTLSSVGPTSVGSSITETQAEALLGVSEAEGEQGAAAQPQPRPKPKRLSGAARRRQRLAAQRHSTGDASATPSRPEEMGALGGGPGEATTSQANPGAPKKRARDAGDTPTEATPAPKKNKPAYSQATARYLQVVVVPRDDPTRQIADLEVRHIRRQLTQLIDMLPHSSETVGPQFDRSGLIQGVFRITCANQASLTWLKEAVPRIVAFEGHSYQVMELSQLRRRRRIRVWIPGENYDPKHILERMEKQNRGLNTAGWRLVYRQEKDDGQLLVLDVDDASLELLRKTQGRVHLELSRVTFELPSQGQQDSPQ